MTMLSPRTSLAWYLVMLPVTGFSGLPTLLGPADTGTARKNRAQKYDPASVVIKTKKLVSVGHVVHSCNASTLGG